MQFYHTVMCPKDGDGMASSVDPEQPDLGLLFIHTCLFKNSASNRSLLRKKKNMCVSALKKLGMVGRH